MVAKTSISLELFRKFRDIAYSQAGIWLPDNKRVLVATRIQKRLRTLGLSSPAQYLDYLRRNDEELVHFLNVITTNFTYFFREEEHFSVLARYVRSRLRQGVRRMRMWCAASSTGEEPWSIAITVLEALGLARDQVDFRLLATDISTRALKTAMAGCYTEERVQDVPDRILRKYFTRSTDDNGDTVYCVKDVLRDLVVYRRLNLAKPPFPMKGPLEVIFVRNVMIYFDREVKKRLTGELERLIRPGGLVITSHSESLTGITERLELVMPSVYRMPEESQ